MKLSDLLYADFDATIRSRGLKYYRQGLVRILEGSDTDVQAAVRGSYRYDVELNLEDDKLLLWCECPYYETSGPCKHLWATVLAADQYGYLGAAFANAKVRPIFGESDELRFSPAPNVAPAPKPPQWRRQLSEIGAPAHPVFSNRTWPRKREIVYLIDVSSSQTHSRVILKLCSREPSKKGGWNTLKELRLDRSGISQLPQAPDREILSLLTGSQQYWGYYSDGYEAIPNHCQLAPSLASVALPRIVSTGRCYLKSAPGTPESPPLSWDGGPPWKLALNMSRDGAKWAVSGLLQRGEERMTLAEPALITAGGFVFTRNCVAALEADTSFEWLTYLRNAGRIEAPEKDREELLRALLESPGAPVVAVPEELRYDEVKLTPQPCLRVGGPKSGYWAGDRLPAELSFNYDRWRVLDSDASTGFYQPETRRLLRRDAEAESAAAAMLLELGLKRPAPSYPDQAPEWEMPAKKLPQVVFALIPAGWHLEAEGKVFRRPGQFRMEVSSGVDWFELRGEVEYGDTSAKLPALLEALRRGENMVKLGDGTFGVLPEDLLARFGQLAALGGRARDHVRFGRNQAGLLDALLAAQPEVRCDETFARVREQLRQFHGVKAAGQPAGFEGCLRDYQREGLGWMHFLRKFGFGGCLADDMGVGKTAQVLALLETRRELRASKQGNGDAPRGPSLVVVPKSLVFNWKQEAARFTPKLRVLDYTGLGRNGDELDGHDIVLTTYGTLRRDALRLKAVEFDYIVLDEAQAVKNAATESAKATRLLHGRHRLALSGTPIENHLGELWSLFEFLNPGMLGAASVFKLAGGALRNPSEETRRMLAHALRPFILRRTKAQVARELPPKTEQSIYCEHGAGAAKALQRVAPALPQLAARAD